MSRLDPAAFTHLHVHSHYSLLQGTVSVHELAERAAAAGFPALALTDSNSLYGAVTFAQACRAAGIQPITGMTVTLSAPPEDIPDEQSARGLLVLLATGQEGYRSLCRLSACLQAHSDRENRLTRGLSWSDLQRYAAGLICIEGGPAGWLMRLLQARNHRAAARYAGRLAAIFPDHCFAGLEVQRPSDISLLQEAIRIGDRFGMRPVVAQPVYTLESGDADLLPLMAAIDRNIHMEQLSITSRKTHWLSPAQIGERFAQFPEAIANVAQIIEQCNQALPGGSPIWPTLDLPEGQDAAQALREQAEGGLKRRLAHSVLRDDSNQESGKTKYETRLARELTAIIDQGFAPLFLVVADIVRFARSREIPVSTRGSVANSLAAYALGITTIDSQEQDLLFERFLNPARANLPDIDLDFCSRRRDEVLDYVRQKYGEDRVALVGTMNTLQPKSAVREVGKAYGLHERRLKHLSTLVPRHWHPDPRRRELPDVATVLTQLEDTTEKEVVRQAWRLVGQPHHLSLHPGGIVITPGPLTDVVPVQWATKGFLTTQFDYRDVEKIGLPKIDLLGIRALTVLADAVDLIRRHQDPHFRPDDIPQDDEQTGDLIQQGETIGVFQCESTGAQRTQRQLKARRLTDLAVANAFFKPGPATGGMAKSFIRRYRGEEKVDFLHPALRPILEMTKGVLLFQEQVLRIAVEIAGLSWQQADHLRRGMSKFRAREMATMRLAFITGCQRMVSEGPMFTLAQAETLWEQVMAFAGYGFNQGHALAYANVSYRSAYLKAHYPAEFLCARLMDRGGFHHPAIYMAEAKRLGISVRPPHVNVSLRKVSLTYGLPEPAKVQGPADDGPIFWLGLGQVRDLRRSAIKAIINKRPFDSLRDLMDRVQLQTKEILHLIQCGALDGLGASRAALLAEAEEVARAGSTRQMSFSFVEEPEVSSESTSQRLEWETFVLGLPVSVFPMALELSGEEIPIRQLPQHRDRLVKLQGVRLPGWTGGKGWFLSDGDDFVIVRGQERPAAWRPIEFQGRYRRDEWGGGWFQIE